LLEKSSERSVTTMTLDDVDHYTPDEKAKIAASYPSTQESGPTMGSGYCDA
jgi:hypothetical protein